MVNGNVDFYVDWQNTICCANMYTESLSLCTYMYESWFAITLVLIPKCQEKYRPTLQERRIAYANLQHCFVSVHFAHYWEYRVHNFVVSSCTIVSFISRSLWIINYKHRIIPSCYLMFDTNVLNVYKYCKTQKRIFMFESYLIFLLRLVLKSDLTRGIQNGCKKCHCLVFVRFVFYLFCFLNCLSNGLWGLSL